MPRKDFYYNKAKVEGYRSRASYKLKQINEVHKVIKKNDSVVDIGAAPGGWLQVARELSKSGVVIGVDLQKIEPLEEVITIRGDITKGKTKENNANTTLKMRISVFPKTKSWMMRVCVNYILINIH